MSPRDRSRACSQARARACAEGWGRGSRPDSIPQNLASFIAAGHIPPSRAERRSRPTRAAGPWIGWTRRYAPCPHLHRRYNSRKESTEKGFRRHDRRSEYTLAKPPSCPTNRDRLGAAAAEPRPPWSPLHVVEDDPHGLGQAFYRCLMLAGLMLRLALVAKPFHRGFLVGAERALA